MAMRIEEVRGDLAARLRDRRPEIEAAIFARVQAVSAQGEDGDPQYAHGLRIAVSAAIEHALCALERNQERAPPVPPVLLAQARLAAQGGVSLDTVLRRYLAGYTLLGDYLLREIAAGSANAGDSAQRLLRAQAALLDRLLAAIGEEYRREQRALLSNAAGRRADRVKRLLDGELIGTADLAYELDQHHLGVVGLGDGAAEAIRELTTQNDRRLLLIRREQGTVWAWLGSRRAFDSGEVEELAARGWPPGVSLALGEPGEGLAGWRLTHRQAKAALPVARRGPQRVVRYAHVALLASILRDEILLASLRQLYLAPLARESDGGTTLRETLRAYFAHEHNLTSTAAALRVTRQTVRRRLRAAERILGTPPGMRAMDIEAALRLEELERTCPEEPMPQDGTSRNPR